jgi:membrane-associated phospholipid phosphatase
VGFFLYKRDLSKDLKFFKAIIIFYLIIILFFLLISFILGPFGTRTSSAKISYFNSLFFNIDKSVFGFNLPFWLQDVRNPLKPVLDFLAFPIILVYMNMALAMGTIFLLALTKGKDFFYRVVLSFALVLIIGIPLWGLFPAIAPFEAYYDNVHNLEVPKNVQDAMTTYQPNQTLVSFFDSVKDLNVKFKDFYAITTMPSMHIAWSVIIVYFGFLFYRPLITVLAPYFVLNGIATIYILQHYTIDLPAGFLVAVTSIWLAGIIASKTKTPKIIVILAETIKEDIVEYKYIIKKIFNKA